MFRRKSTWDKVREPLVARTPDRATVRSGLVAAGAAAGVTLGLTALSSAVSAMRRRTTR